MTTRHTAMGFKRWLALPCLAAALSASAGAWASPNYPDVVQEVADSQCVPSCLLCHNTNPGRSGTVSMPFGITAVTRKLVGSMSDSAARAVFLSMRDGNVDLNLDGVPEPATNVDGDGMTDFQELAAGIDPNPGDADLCEITYGCGARIAPTPPSSNVALYGGVLTALGLALMGLRKRRR